MKETGKNEVRIYLTSPFRYFIDMVRTPRTHSRLALTP